MSEMTEEQAGGGDAALTRQIEELQAKIADAEKRAEEAQRKFEMTKNERAEEREKRQKEAEEKSQYAEASKLKDEAISELKVKLDEATLKLSELENLKPAADAWTQYQQTRRTELLEKIPEDVREEFREAPLALLERTVSLLDTGQTGAGSRNGSPKAPSTGGSRKWSEMSDAERAEKARDLPVEELRKLISQG